MTALLFCVTYLGTFLFPLVDNTFSRKRVIPTRLCARPFPYGCAAMHDFIQVRRRTRAVEGAWKLASGMGVSWCFFLGISGILTAQSLRFVSFGMYIIDFESCD